MHCPICKKASLKNVELAPDLTGKACEICAGTWVPRHNYDLWRKRHPGDRPEHDAPASSAITDRTGAKICPDCGHLLLPYRIGHGLPFALDYCGTCGGVWLDPKEWEAIKAKNLHDNLHDIISEHWQKEVREEKTRELLENTFRRLLGPSYDKAAEIRAWLRSQPRKSVILAYLKEKE